MIMTVYKYESEGIAITTIKVRLRMVKVFIAYCHIERLIAWIVLGDSR